MDMFMKSLVFAEPVPVQGPSECAFYQTFDWPNGQVVQGRWDYRANAGALLGNLDMAGKTVLEIGPASGFFTVELEKRGASQVICIDTSDDEPWEAVPRRDVDFQQFLEERKRGQLWLRRGWWLTQKVFGGNAKMAYTGVGVLPKLIGHVNFDVCLISCVLQHFRSPLDVLFNVSDLAREVIVTEPYLPRLEKPGTAEFRPAPGNKIVDSWWKLSSKIISNVMTMRGYEQVSFQRNTVRRWDRMAASIENDTYREVEFYTSVFRKRE